MGKPASPSDEAVAVSREQTAPSSPASGEGKRFITTAEMGKHNSRESAWIAVRGKVYDVTKFIDRHPGGADILLYAVGRDATQVFEMYHQLKTHAVLPKYYLGELADNELPVFPNSSEFFSTLKDRVYSHLERKGVDPKIAPGMWFRYACIYAAVGFTYYAQFFIWPQGGWQQWLAAVVLGFFCAQIGLNPLHDASHFTITHKPALWKFFGATHDFLNGASYIVWIYQHMLGHHPYTNIAGADPDISTNEPADVRRIKPSQQWFSHYMNQEWFVPVLYGVLGIKTRIQDVTIMYTLKSNDKIRVNPMTPYHTAVFWAGKAFFFFHRILVPVLFCGLSWGRTLALFAVADAVSSYWLALTFQANHVVEEVDWPHPNEKNEMACDWAKMQLQTTQDYAHGSLFWTSATGCLNYQSCHHVFPEVSQWYYPMITREVIIPTCKEFGVPYLVQPTFTSALSSHLSYLKLLGARKHPADLAKQGKAE